MSALLIKPDLAALPPGGFLMGGIPEDKFVSAVELPRHQVVFSQPFAIGRFPVTQAEWRQVMGDSSTQPSSCPVVNVSIPDVLLFLDKLSRAHGQPYRLPSEAEWEYACRAGSETVFSHRNDLDASDANFLYDEMGARVGKGHLTATGTYPPNPFGLFDLLGNVCEWTADSWHSSYDGAPTDGTAWIDGENPTRHVIRGGGWDHLPRVLRCSWRDWAPADARWDNLAFRIALSL
jgi:formylglycine-generating enzyme required for sulfatase activity